MRNTLKQYVQTAKTFAGYAMEDKEITNAVKVSAATAALLTGAEFTRRMYRDHGLKAMYSFKAGAQGVRDNKALYAGYALAVLVYYAARVNGEYQTGQRIIRKIESVELDLYENSLQEVNEFLSTLTPVDHRDLGLTDLYQSSCKCGFCSMDEYTYSRLSPQEQADLYESTAKDCDHYDADTWIQA